MNTIKAQYRENKIKLYKSTVVPCDLQSKVGYFDHKMKTTICVEMTDVNWDYLRQIEMYGSVIIHKYI